MQLQRKGIKLCYLNRVGERKNKKNENLSVTFLAILSLVPIFHFPIPRSRFPIPDSRIIRK